MEFIMVFLWEHFKPANRETLPPAVDEGSFLDDGDLKRDNSSLFFSLSVFFASTIIGRSSDGNQDTSLRDNPAFSMLQIRDETTPNLDARVTNLFTVKHKQSADFSRNYCAWSDDRAVQ